MSKNLHGTTKTDYALYDVTEKELVSLLSFTDLFENFAMRKIRK